MCPFTASFSQAAAEEKAAASAKEGLGKRVKEAEASAQALAESVEELRLTLDRQRASAELRYLASPTKSDQLQHTGRAPQFAACCVPSCYSNASVSTIYQCDATTSQTALCDHVNCVPGMFCDLSFGTNSICMSLMMVTGSPAIPRLMPRFVACRRKRT